MTITEFFSTDYVDYASYSNIRAIASAVDGQKNVWRKVLCTILDKNISNELKVSQLNSKMAEYTEYLHGDSSGAIVTMAQNFVGTNNMPLLVREGNFGTRFVPDASAPRYIMTHGEKYVTDLFNKDDNDILIRQEFEGEEIEPRFYLPSLPLLLINGSESPSTGFAQKILPRSPEKIKQFLINKLDAKGSRYNFEPYFEGFKGVVQPGIKSQWDIMGVITKKSMIRYTISELPLGQTLKSYLKILDNLVENGTIKSFKDNSDDDQFSFEVVSGNFKTMTEYQILDKMKLIKRVTEIYTAFDENNKIHVFGSAQEIFEYYYEVKLKYMALRKASIQEKISTHIDELTWKLMFIENTINGKITVNGAKKASIVKDIQSVKTIGEVDGSYDYLLRMPIYSLTHEKMKELEDKIKAQRLYLYEVQTRTLADMWKGDL